MMVQQLAFLFWVFNLLFRRVFFSGKHQDNVAISQKTAGSNLQLAGKLSVAETVGIERPREHWMPLRLSSLFSNNLMDSGLAQLDSGVTCVG